MDAEGVSIGRVSEETGLEREAVDLGGIQLCLENSLWRVHRPAGGYDFACQSAEPIIGSERPYSHQL